MIALLFVQGIAKALPSCSLIERTSVAGPGFVNVVLSNSWIEEVSFVVTFIMWCIASMKGDDCC